MLGALEKLRSANAPMWDGYRPGTGASYVFLLRGSDQRWCGAVWKAGAVRIISLVEEPRLPTPMFGFHLSLPAGNAGFPPGLWTQPAALAAQLGLTGLAARASGRGTVGVSGSRVPP